MDIIQVKESIGGRNVRLDEAMDKLIQIYEFTGNKAQVGFLGNISNVGKDDLGNFEFNTEYSSGGLDSISTGVVLDDSAIIKQIQKSDNINVEPSYQIYSWDTDTCDYVWIAFTNSDAMNFAYNRMKVFKDNINRTDIANRLVEMGISSDDVANVKFYEGKAKETSVSSMVDEAIESENQMDNEGFELHMI